MPWNTLFVCEWLGKIDSVWDTVSNGCLNDSDKIFLYKGKIMFYLGLISFAAGLLVIALPLFGMYVDYKTSQLDYTEE